MSAAVLAFPMTPQREFRLSLARCHNQRMIDRWFARVQLADNGLTEPEYIELAKVALDRGRALRVEAGL